LRYNWYLKVVKLGGSVITLKDMPMTIRYDVVKQLVSELADAVKGLPDLKLVIIHGGGGFGHYVVRKCLSSSGRIDSTCFSETSYAMTLLNTSLLKELLGVGLPVVSIPPHTVFKVEVDGRVSYDKNLIIEYLVRGLIPVLYGDVVLGVDSFLVLSGDTIAWLLAKDLNAYEIIFVTDVDGLFDKDPKKYSDARLLKYVRADELVNLEFSQSEYDVTGSMMFKLMEGLKHGVKGINVRVVNGLVKGNLYKSLHGNSSIGTVIKY